MKTLFLKANILFLLLTLLSCGSNNNIDPIGNWTTPLSSDTFSGIEYLSFNNDNSFTTQDTMNFSMKEKGLKVDISYLISNSGVWSRKSDSIFVKYDSSKINVICNSFDVSALRQDANNDSINKFQKSMREDFDRAIRPQLIESYQAIADQDILLGIIKQCDHTALVLENNNVTSRFTAVR
ncbi:MAG: hypothetical protein K2K94_02640 [Muribaculaceae bacterium]|nr:hypothetical protein [Muribaculaceae bacterium]